MKWVDKPQLKNGMYLSAYYWAKYKNEEDWLDGIPEMVYLYYDGKYSVYRPGIREKFNISDFTSWSDEHFYKYPEFED